MGNNSNSNVHYWFQNTLVTWAHAQGVPCYASGDFTEACDIMPELKLSGPGHRWINRMDGENTRISINSPAWRI